jgi:radical SAM protein with 4Fe4S-binding SPASM domain
MRNFDINGGEIFLYEHWYDLLKLLYENNFEPYISTKVPLNRDVIKKLKDLSIKGIQISIDSVDEKELLLNLNRNTNYKEGIIRTLHLLEEYEIPFYTNSVITKFNSSIVSIGNLVNFLVTFKYIKRIGLTAAGYSLYKTEAEFQEYKASLKDLDAIRDYIDSIKLKHIDIKIFMGSHLVKDDIISEFDDVKLKEMKFKKRASCTGNIENFYILPDGKVTICEELYWNPKFLIGDLMKNSIMEVWNSKHAQSLYNINQKLISENSACRNCEEFKNCRTYPGVCWKMVLYAYGENNWDFPDPRCFKANKPEKVFYM